VLLLHLAIFHSGGNNRWSVCLAHALLLRGAGGCLGALFASVLR
jgi:hypothetical protein